MGVLIKIEPVANLHIPDEGMDVCMMVHPGQSQVGQASISPTLAVQSFEVEFHGVSTENHYCCKQIFDLQRIRNLHMQLVPLGMVSMR